jgi:hypothetical protein
MKILYFSDTYSYGVMGTKRSIAEEMMRRGHVVVFIPRTKIDDILFLIEDNKPDQVWLAHSGLELPEGLKEYINIPIIGFGFSDPYYFNPKRTKSYDVYVTNYHETYKMLGSSIPVIYSPTACDIRFHTSRPSTNIIYDLSIIGRGQHPRFKNKQLRIETLKKLKDDLPQKNIGVFGKDWEFQPNNHIEGEVFLEVIRSSRIGLDIQDEHSPLSRKIMEYSACGIPVITRKRKEVERHFMDGSDILMYETYDELLSKLEHYLGKPEALKIIGRNAMQLCKASHDIANRVDRILYHLAAMCHENNCINTNV